MDKRIHRTVQPQLSPCLPEFTTDRCIITYFNKKYRWNVYIILNLLPQVDLDKINAVLWKLGSQPTPAMQQILDKYGSPTYISSYNDYKSFLQHLIDAQTKTSEIKEAI